jgi:hypothetical protein
MSNHLYRLVLQVSHESAEAFAEAIEIHCDTVAWTEQQGETTAKVTGFSLKLPKEETVVRAVSIAAEAMGVLAPEVDISQISPKNWVLEISSNFPRSRLDGFLFMVVTLMVKFRFFASQLRFRRVRLLALGITVQPRDA